MKFWDTIWANLFHPLFQGVGWLIGLLYAIVLAWGIFFIAIVIIVAMLREKRQPGNIFAWSLAMLLMPYLGVPLYLLLGGRKSRRLVRNKKRFLDEALTVAGIADLADFNRACREGNSCELLGDGVTTFHALLHEIQQSTDSIHITTYILANDESGQALVAALSERAKAGVTVRLLIDSFGSLTNQGSALRQFRAAGGELSRFMPMLPLHSHSSANLRNHRKLAIFDQRCVITGGQNLDQRFIAAYDRPGLFADFSLRIRGPVLQAFQLAFLSDWAFSTRQPPNRFRRYLRSGPAPAGNRRIEVIESGPEVDGDPLYDRIICAVQECRSHMTLVTPYFVPDEVLFRSLIVKAHMGRRVRLILPRRSNHRLVDLARYHFVRELHRAGVEVLLYLPRMLHAKLLLVDDALALTGSANFDMRSLFVNFEIGVVHTSPEDVAFLQGWVDALLPHCVVFEREISTRPGLRRRLAEDIAHLMSPLL